MRPYSLLLVLFGLPALVAGYKCSYDNGNNYMKDFWVTIIDQACAANPQTFASYLAAGLNNNRGSFGHPDAVGVVCGCPNYMRARRNARGVSWYAEWSPSPGSKEMRWSLECMLAYAGDEVSCTKGPCGYDGRQN